MFFQGRFSNLKKKNINEHITTYHCLLNDAMYSLRIKVTAHSVCVTLVVFNSN